MQGYGETYCLWSASTSEQSNYTPSARISYKTLYLYPTLRNIKRLDFVFKKQKFGVDSVYLDFAKAFDTVSHVKLLTKLTGYGIRGHLLGWIRAFLSSRFKTYKIDHFLSSPSYVKSGVPQGSILEPILLLIYINDITGIFSGPVSIKLYADDAKLYSNIRCPDDSSFLFNQVLTL